MTNAGYSAEEIGELKAEMKSLKQNFVINEEHEERDAEGVYFYFVGKHEGKEVIFDAFDIEFKQADEEIVFRKRIENLV